MSVDPRPPHALRTLVSWQAARVATIGTRLTAARMPLEARSDFAVLSALQEYGPLSQADIGRVLGLDRNNVNGIVVRLDADESVLRTPDPADRRRNIVTITANGGERLADLRTQADAVQDELLAALSPADRDALVRLLGDVLAAHPAQPA
ncbi:MULTISPECIES: MarR family winged helix-turn-helix transcriptional regulator [unclassified Curtobacterium]|uniref:MarR family winged helix-turn-helix transcriptional regulator n=1 Tax=unclassified Curtobacterium TaxID=257496 RepID=UPI000DA947E2|nr:MULTISPECIES: MarR family transcriptional regulator [unclassified Curtobacterium]PZF56393.1 MarR family transcriptional regulator [Curtobacterium sp. MCBD17_034]PZE23196.1 MarR family transcriptional regulator [Curtobacterium sp. MCBD17_028]PZE73906.1 MarR family transcriptional regulator [Curtobacterium sp. MCBD17_019]PZM33261.1 MarR family transcriptional regulator [Curtobacterium sp. MCBD17_031]WIB63004.1 MarR family transcriptional regulator [Curtobacterium sp. MCBD17_040]